VAGLAQPRSGHFDLGTGYHGDVWLDLDALFLRPALLRPHVGWLADRLREHRVDAVCGPMEGGAFLAQSLADHMETAFLAAHRGPASAGAATAYRIPRCAAASAGGGWRLLMTRLTRARPSWRAAISCAAGERPRCRRRPDLARPGQHHHGCRVAVAVLRR
jgi:hypothetical protein